MGDDVRGIGHGDDERPILHPHRQRLVPLRAALGKVPHGVLLGLRLAQVDELEPVLLGERLGQVAGRDQPEADEGLAERKTAPLLLRESLFQALDREESSADEEAAEERAALGRCRRDVDRRGLDGHGISIGGRRCPH